MRQYMNIDKVSSRQTLDATIICALLVVSLSLPHIITAMRKQLDSKVVLLALI